MLSIIEAGLKIAFQRHSDCVTSISLKRRAEALFLAQAKKNFQTLTVPLQVVMGR